MKLKYRQVYLFARTINANHDEIHCTFQFFLISIIIMLEWSMYCSAAFYYVIVPDFWQGQWGNFFRIQLLYPNIRLFHSLVIYRWDAATQLIFFEPPTYYLSNNSAILLLTLFTIRISFLDDISIIEAINSQSPMQLEFK